MYDIEDVQTIKDCKKITLVDAYGEYEQVGCYLEEVFAQTKYVKLLGEKVHLKGFEVLSGIALIAIARAQVKILAGGALSGSYWCGAKIN